MESIVLTRRDFREFDQIISLYTKDKGKQELLARGVKKIISKNAAHLEPFSYVLATSVPGKEINHLTKVQPIDSFSNIRSNLTKSLAAQFISSLTDRVTEPGEPDKRIFELLKSWLRFVDRSDVVEIVLIDGFVLKLFDMLGFSPILSECVVCGKSFQDIMKNNLKDGSNPGFYFSGGGLVCEVCRETKEKVQEKIITCGLKEASAMEAFLHGDWRVIQEFNFSNTEKKLLHTLIYEFALFHSEKKLTDWKTCFSY